MAFLLNENIFKKNDIRGIVGEGIDFNLYEIVARAYAEYINLNTKEKNKEIWISVGMDARLHSPGFAKALINSLLSCGINVLDLGLCPTPLAYYSEFVDLKDEGISEISGSLIVTASHNPSDYNGIKITFNKQTFSDGEIEKLKNLVKQEINNNSSTSEKKGIYREYNMISKYIERMSKDFSEIGKGLKIVVDSGNATAGIVAPELYRKVGCEVIDIFSEPDGNFPNHHPDPSKDSNLVALREKVLESNADFGIAFDGDSDRIGVVDNMGNSIPGDKLLLVFALDILNNNNNMNKPVFISEVKCSQVLYNLIEENGGKAIMWKTGHAYIKSKMKEENATLAGEMSGHIFFKDRYYGFDDAIYAGNRIIEIIASSKRKNPDFNLCESIDSFPKVYTSKEERVPCPDNLKQIIISELYQEIKNNPEFLGAKVQDVITIDGLRIIFDDGFALIRASNTEPTFTLRFESSSLENLNKYKDNMLSIVDSKLKKIKITV